MNRLTTAAACLLSTTAISAGNTLLFSDTFNTFDGQLSGSDTTGRVFGSAGSETALESFGAHQFIAGNRVDLVNTGGMRFGPETDRYNWAGATTGADILGTGGFVVTFDWTHNGSSSEWIAWKMGTDNADTGVNVASVDHALLLRQAPTTGGATNERWDNGANLGDSGISYNPVPGVTTTYPVRLTYTFDSFADDTPVHLSAVVNGIEVVSDDFTWDGNGGELRMELQTNIEGNFIDNLSVATIPVLDTTLDVAEFGSGAPQGQAIGTLVATPPGGTSEPATFALVAGDGSTDNNLFQINGSTLEVGDYDFTLDPPDSTYSIRVQATGQDSGKVDESIVLITSFEDVDNDLLPDDWETYWSFGPLDELDGRATGPGPGALTGDLDGDGLTDLQEYQFSETYPDLDPYEVSSDFDPLSDFEELFPEVPRPVTDPTREDTDGDGLEDDVESNTGTFVDADDTGTNPVLWDTDGDGSRDDFEIAQGGNPNDAGVLPPLSPGLSLALLTDDASSGISAAKTYTHAIAGGAAATVNGVAFEALTDVETPLNLNWEVISGGVKGNIVNNPGEWNAAEGGVVGPGLGELLNSFAYSTGKDPLGTQVFTLSGLTPGQSYELSIMARTWDINGPGRPIDLTFTNGASAVPLFGPLLEDRPDVFFGGASVHSAYVVRYLYTAEGTEVRLEGMIPTTEDPLLEGTGGFHLYALANAVVGEGGSELEIHSVSREASGELTIRFSGEAETPYRVTKSGDLAGAFEPLSTPLEVSTDATGQGTAVVPATETTEPGAFFRVEDTP